MSAGARRSPISYTLSIPIILGPSQTGLTLKAILVDTAGATVGSEVTTGFVEIGGGNYLWTYASVPDAHRGGVKFYTGTLPTGLKAFAGINPEQEEGVSKLSATGLDAIPTTAPTGVASTFREMLVQTWRRFFKKAVLDATADTLKTYADNGTTVITTQTATSAAGVETQGSAT